MMCRLSSITSFRYGRRSRAARTGLAPLTFLHFPPTLQLFNVPCSKWVQLFYPGAVFSHPKAGRVEGHEALQSFCQGAQASAAPQMFRQDGDALVTATGSGANAQCSLLVPYVWVQAPASSTGEFMSNTGFESMVLIPTNTTEPRYAILSVTEFFSRSARPFVWPQS